MTTKTTPWTKKEETFLLKNLGRPAKEVALELNRSYTAIYRKARRLGGHFCKVPPPNKWSDAEEQLLLQHAATSDISQLEKMLRKSKKAIRAKASRLKVHLRKPQTKDSWSSTEATYLIKNYRQASSEEITKALGRTLASVYKKAQMLGLSKKMGPKRCWTKEEDTTIRKYAGLLEGKVLAEKLERTHAAVKRRANILGLSLRTALLSYKDLEMLIDNKSLLNRDKFYQWPNYGLRIKSIPNLYADPKNLRSFWKKRPEAMNVYALDESTLEELGVDLDAWPEPPNYKVISCSGRHPLALNCFDLYESRCRCYICKKALSSWACGYSNEWFTPIAYTGKID